MDAWAISMKKHRTLEEKKQTNQKQGEQEIVFRNGNSEDNNNNKNICSFYGVKVDETPHHAE